MFVRGVAGTTLEQVREAAQVSSSQIYHYFADKDALVHAVVEYQNDAVVGSQEDHLGSLSTVADLQVWRDHIVEHQRRFSARAAARSGRSAPSSASWTTTCVPGCRRVTTVGRPPSRGYADAEDRLLPAETDVDRLATATLATLQGGLLLCQMHRSTKPLEAALDTIIDHVQHLTEQTRPASRR